MARTNANYQRDWMRKCRQDPECNERTKLAVSRSKQKYREYGGCITCGKPAQPELSLCVACAIKQYQISRMGYWLRKCKAVEVLGGACAECGQEDVRILELDHKHNDGKDHRKEMGSIKGTGGIIGWILKHPDEARERLQVLCANCHALKRWSAQQ